MLLGFMVFVSYNDELIKVFLFLHKLYIHVFTQRQSNTFLVFGPFQLEVIQLYHPEGSRRFQKVPEGYRRFQKVTEGYSSLHADTVVCRQLQ